MRTHSRHALGLVLLLLLAAVLSGCFRSAGGSLEPTPVAFDGGMVAQQTPVVLPSLTPTVADIEPTTEIATEPPTPIPPSPTPTEADIAALPGDQGGADFGLTPTEPVIAMLPTFTSIPLPTAQPTAGPTATFTSIPFNPLPPTPTYTQFMPPAQGEAMPLGELGPGTPPAEEIAPPADGQGGLEAGVAGVEIAQVGTITIPQMTSTAMIAEYNMTQAAIQGTIFPTSTPDPALQQQQAPLEQQGVEVPQPTEAFPAATTAGICSEHLISPGENLFRISQRYGVTVDAIAQANNLVNPALILAGNTLQIPCQSPASTGTTDGQGGAGTVPSTSPGTYIVEPGDNLYRISIRFGVSMSALMSANGMTPSTINFLRAGQQLVIP